MTSSVQPYIQPSWTIKLIINLFSVLYSFWFLKPWFRPSIANISFNFNHSQLIISQKKSLALLLINHKLFSYNQITNIFQTKLNNRNYYFSSHWGKNILMSKIKKLIVILFVLTLLSHRENKKIYIIHRNSNAHTNIYIYIYILSSINFKPINSI